MINPGSVLNNSQWESLWTAYAKGKIDVIELKDRLEEQVNWVVDTQARKIVNLSEHINSLVEST